MPRYVRRIRTGLILSCLAAAIALVVSIRLREATVAAAAAALIEPLPADVAVALHRVGLEPAPLAAGGLSIEDVNTLAENATDWWALNGTALDLADENRGAAKAELDRLTRIVRSGAGTQEDLSALAAARTTFNTSDTARTTLLDDLFADATADCHEDEQVTLSHMRANADRTASLEFKVIERSTPQWLELRNALANERIAAKRGEEPDPELQALLQQLRAVPAFQAARASLEANLPAITAAWEAAVGV